MKNKPGQENVNKKFTSSETRVSPFFLCVCKLSLEIPLIRIPTLLLSVTVKIYTLTLKMPNIGESTFFRQPFFTLPLTVSVFEINMYITSGLDVFIYLFIKM